jgi:hypothetical protein
MKHARYLFILSLLVFSTLALAADIQVSCEPGLRVYFDGELMGTSSSKDDGLFLMNVPRGAHTIRIEKEKAAVSVKQLVGNLLVTSAPQNCEVEIDGEVRTKNSP